MLTAAIIEVESAKLMRQAADILSSAPAMQIRYLEAMQAMAKTANSKVIFLPATNQTLVYATITPHKSSADRRFLYSVQQQLAEADKHGEGPSSYQNYTEPSGEFGNSQGFVNAQNARVIENM